MGAIIRAAEQMDVKLDEGRPLESRAPPSRETANLGRRLHGAQAGEVEEPQAFIQADELGPDDAEVEGKIMGHKGDLGVVDGVQKLIQDFVQVFPRPDGSGVRNSMDLRRLSRNPLGRMI